MTKVELVSTKLKERILGGEWAPGKPLPSRGQLAEEFGLSPATVTAALRILERNGLIRVIQGKGAFTTDPQNASEGLPRAVIGLTGSYVAHGQGGKAHVIFDGIWKAASDQHTPLVLLPQLAMQEGVTQNYCRRLGIQGLIFLGGEGYNNARKLKEEGFPVILANKPVEATPLNYVDYDNGWMLHQMVERFANVGHKRIAVLYREGSVPSYYDDMRLRFLGALQDCGLSYPIAPYWQKVEEGPESVEAILHRLFSLPEPPTALFFWDPKIATRASLYLDRHALTARVSIQVSSYTSPEQVTTSGYMIPHYKLGVTLVQELCNTIANPHHAAQILLKPEFVDQGTVFPPPKKKT